MLGNDIVDLQLANVQSNWRRKGYLQKIFTAAEQELISNSAKPNILVWKFWTMKESAYKIYNKQTGVRTFEPSLIFCEVDDEFGEVYINGKAFFTKSTISAKYIHTIASLNLQVLRNGKAGIYRGNARNFDYHALKPKSISHHGDYLALAGIG